MIQEGLSFDDVLLVPQHGTLHSRADADIRTLLINGWLLPTPIISANMPSVTGADMALALWGLGGISFLPRFASVADNIRVWETIRFAQAWAVPSVGLEDHDRFDALLGAGARVFCLDVAHGDHERVVDWLEAHQSYGLSFVVGNVATYDGASRLIDAGAASLKVGIGPGAACTTREVTGHGVPQLTAIMEVTRAIESYGVANQGTRDEKRVATLIADGGIKNSGDIVKALAAGADTVMLGRLFAGTDEANTPGHYAGNASNFVRIDPHHAPEGVAGQIERTGPVEDLMKSLTWGLRSGLSYAGAANIYELRDDPEFIRVTHFTALESGVRL